MILKQRSAQDSLLLLLLLKEGETDVRGREANYLATRTNGAFLVTQKSDFPSSRLKQKRHLELVLEGGKTKEPCQP